MNSCLNLKRVLTSKSGPIPKQFNVLWKGSIWLYQCFYSILLLKQKYHRNHYCNETDFFRNKVNEQLLEKIVLSWHISMQLSWASCCVIDCLHFPLSTSHKTRLALTSTLTSLYLLCPAAQMTHCHPYKSLLRLSHSNCFRFLTHP